VLKREQFCARTRGNAGTAQEVAGVARNELALQKFMKQFQFLYSREPKTV
jgi:hypothetical protein